MVFADGTAGAARRQVATMEDESRRERKAFFYFLYASIVLAVYLLVMNVVELEDQVFPKPAYYVTAVVLLFHIFFPLVLLGGTLTAIDNVGQIGQSLGYPQQSISTLVSLVSIWNYAGRVVTGFASEHVLSRYKVPRPLLLTAVLLVACSGHLLVAQGVNNALYRASVILGFCFGAQWPLLFAIISEVFVLKYCSTVYNLGAVASLVGSYILNVRLAGWKYDEEALRQVGDLTCIGVYIIAGVTLLGALVSLLLGWRTARKFYRGDLYGKFKEVGMAGSASSANGGHEQDQHVHLLGEERSHDAGAASADHGSSSCATPRDRSHPNSYTSQGPRSRSLLWFLLLLLCCVQASAYDPLDPRGNITVSWDFLDIKDSYSVSVSLHNYQLYRHLEDPGWRLSWFWTGDEVILEATGAEATEQGNCTRSVGAQSCEKQPVMVDLGPGTPYNRQVANCCRGGVLSSLTQDSKASTSTFLMTVGNFAPSSDGSPQMPFNFSIGVPGYTCSNASVVPPTRTQTGRQHHSQALMTWQVSCFFSQTVAGPRKSCCVSLSAFYSSTIVECPRCICGACAVTSMGPQCKGPEAEPAIRCTGHMCPIRVHWHVKKSYRGYWRVKLSALNFNQLKNYSDWNLVVQHPGMQNLTQVFSFNHHPLVQYGAINDTELFWGLPNFNKMLLQDGNVQTEILLRKDEDFTFAAGWAFPRKIYFDGGECAMPSPQNYPQLPSASCDQRLSAVLRLLIVGFVLVVLLF